MPRGAANSYILLSILLWIELMVLMIAPSLVILMFVGGGIWGLLIIDLVLTWPAYLLISKATNSIGRSIGKALRVKRP